MPAFDVWDIVKVPFPYTERPVRQRRPALVVGASRVQESHGLLWVVMITSAENRGGPGDVAVSDLVEAGLPAPSVVRTTKIATIEAKEAEYIGILPERDRRMVMQRLWGELAPPPTRSTI
jgi:mRNA interferase MazF